MKVVLNFSEAKTRELNWLLKHRYGHRFGLKSLIVMAVSDIVSDEAEKAIKEAGAEVKKK